MCRWMPRVMLAALMIPAAAAVAGQPFAFTETAPGSATPSGDELVEARLVSDVQSVAAGKTFTLAVQLDIEPDWHVYWRYPGDAGMSTQVKWRLPEGFTAGELQWPIPHKFTESGDITSYGYSDTVTLLAEVTAPNTLPETDKLTFGAEVSWLVCRERCLQGGAGKQLALATDGHKPSEHAGMLRDVAERLPKHVDLERARSADPLTRADPRPFHTGKVRAKPGGRTAVAVFWHLSDGDALATEPPEDVDVYPLPTSSQQVTQLEVDRLATVSNIRVDVDRLDTGADAGRTEALSVLLVWRAADADHRAGAYIDIPLKWDQASE